VRIRRRLALYGAVVTGVTMILFGALLNGLATSAAPEDRDKLLAALAAQASASLAEAPASEFDETSPLLPIDLADSTDQFIAVVGGDGTVVYTTAVLNGAAPVFPVVIVTQAIETGFAATTIVVGGVELRVHAVPFARPDLGLTGAVVAGESTMFVEEQLAGLRAVIVFAGIITLIVAAIVSWLVSGRALQPLRRLAETTSEIARTGDLSRRLPPTNANDEVGRLTSSFDGMLDRLQGAQEQLTSALQAQQRFVADASHELRSPLTTIRNNAGFLMGHPDAQTQDRTEAIADIAAETDRMAYLVDDLLELAVADSHREWPQRPVGLRPLLEAAADRARRHGTVISVAVTGEATVLGDHDALGRMVWILVHNAMTHGGEPIEAKLDITGDSAVITVSDRGEGIPDASLARVFERFYRADPARSPAGAGLGLAIASEVAHRHGGSVSVANRVDGGLVATVTLPLDRT